MLDITDNERKILKALAWLAEQYLGDERGELDDLCMGAGQMAKAVLEEYGLITPHGGRYGRWTEAGRELMNSPEPYP